MVRVDEKDRDLFVILFCDTDNTSIVNSGKECVFEPIGNPLYHQGYKVLVQEKMSKSGKENKFGRKSEPMEVDQTYFCDGDHPCDARHHFDWC